MNLSVQRIEKLNSKHIYVVDGTLADLSGTGRLTPEIFTLMLENDTAIVLEESFLADGSKFQRLVVGNSERAARFMLHAKKGYWWHCGEEVGTAMTLGFPPPKPSLNHDEIRGQTPKRQESKQQSCSL